MGIGDRNRVKPFLRWPSMKACAEEIGAERQTLSDWVRGVSRPRPCPALAALLAAGWDPPPYRGRRTLSTGERLARMEEARGLKPPLGPEQVSACTFETLRKAKSRPAGCSPARWRMELARRRRGHGVRLDPDEI